MIVMSLETPLMWRLRRGEAGETENGVPVCEDVKNKNNVQAPMDASI
jgi:hypothetical protein